MMSRRLSSFTSLANEADHAASLPSSVVEKPPRAIPPSASPPPALPGRGRHRRRLSRPAAQGVLAHVLRRDVVDRHRQGARRVAGVALLDLLSGGRRRFLDGG